MRWSLFQKSKEKVSLNKRNDLISQLPDIVSALQNGKLVQFETHGFSMVPLLRDGGDRIILKKALTTLKSLLLI